MQYIEYRLGLYAQWFWEGDALLTRAAHDHENRLDIGGLRLCLMTK